MNGPDGEEPAGVGSVGEEAAKLFEVLAEQLGAAAGSVNDHVATGGTDCRYCPVCQAIGVVRATSPEVRAHLTTAAGALLQAASGLLATHVPPERDRGPVEHIDLDGDEQPGHQQ